MYNLQNVFRPSQFSVVPEYSIYPIDSTVNNALETAFVKVCHMAVFCLSLAQSAESDHSASTEKSL